MKKTSLSVPKPRQLPSGNWFIQMRLGGESISITEYTASACIRAAQAIKAEHKNTHTVIDADKLEYISSAGLRVILRLMKAGKKPTAILGFNKREELFYEEQFKALGAEVTVTTVDGSYGIKGFVTDALKEMEYTHFFTCGPEPMLKSVYKASPTSGQMSFEKRMGCGFGACMGCSCKTKYGNKRICKDGPVLEREEIIW